MNNENSAFSGVGAAFDIRELAKRVLLASSLSSLGTLRHDSTNRHARLMKLANLLLNEAAKRGFRFDAELRELLDEGRFSVRTVDLLEKALACIPEDIIGEIVVGWPVQRARPGTAFRGDR